MSCISRAIRARSAAVACSAWRSRAALRAASEAACLRAWTNTPASQNATSCNIDRTTAFWPPSWAKASPSLPWRLISTTTGATMIRPMTARRRLACAPRE